MVAGEGRVERGLFRAVGADRGTWLLAIRHDGGWTITRDGEPVAAGAAGSASVQRAVRTFLSLTRGLVGVGRPSRVDACAARPGGGPAADRSVAAPGQVGTRSRPVKRVRAVAG